MIVGRDEEDRVLLNWGRSRHASLNYPGYRIVSVSMIPRVLTLLPAGRVGRGVDRTVPFAPVPMGVSVGNIGVTAGTSGLVVVDKPLDIEVLLTNAHVVHPDPSSGKPPSDTRFLQPGRFDVEANRLGDPGRFAVGVYLTHQPVSVSRKSMCPVARLKDCVFNLFKRGSMSLSLMDLLGGENLVDAGLVIMDKGFDNRVLMDDGSLRGPRVAYGLVFAGSEADGVGIVCKASHIEEILNVRFPVDVGVPAAGGGAVYCGRTTGETRVEVLSTSMTLTVDYGVGYAVFRDCIVFRGECRGGNSGALLFD